MARITHRAWRTRRARAANVHTWFPCAPAQVHTASAMTRSDSRRQIRFLKAAHGGLQHAEGPNLKGIGRKSTFKVSRGSNAKPVYSSLSI